MAGVQESVTPAVRALADDRTPAVREAAFAAAAGWTRRHRRAGPACDLFISLIRSCPCKCGGPILKTTSKCFL